MSATCRTAVERLLDQLGWPWDAALSLELDRAVAREERPRNSGSPASPAWAGGPRATRPAATWTADATTRSNGNGAGRREGIGPSSSGRRSKRSA